ncbi:MAG: hypothetical protein LH629_16300 [Ignavibacteria bacterium]|nr:hypothetical protein [Ignavibacteria bacterium]
MPDIFTDKKFREFRKSLLNYSRRFSISFEDREDYVSEAIIAGLGSFNEDKGSFEGYCRVIIKNRILNFINRGNIDIILTSILDDNDIIFADEDILFENKENNKIAKKFLKMLRTELSEDEVKLFNEVYETSEFNKKVNISQASENIDLNSSVGWDTFRRIQRKARKLYEGLKDKDEEMKFVIKEYKVVSFHEPQFEYKGKPSDKGEFPDIRFQKAIPKTIDNFEEFISNLSYIQLNKLNLIYNITPDPAIPPPKKSFWKKLFS